MRDEDRIRLKHMMEACEAVAHFVAGRTREDLDSDRMLFFAVVRAVEIIGEAASKISEGTPRGPRHRIRIISAREANRNETKQYFQGLSHE